MSQSREVYVYKALKRLSGKRKDRLGQPILFLLTFEDWWSIWQESGHWEQRGTKSDGYVMSRKDDLGNYEVGNVFIQRHRDNVLDWRKHTTTEFWTDISHKIVATLGPEGCTARAQKGFKTLGFEGLSKKSKAAMATMGREGLSERARKIAESKRRKKLPAQGEHHQHS